MTLVAQQWNNPWHGRATGAAIQRTLEDGCLGPPSGVPRAGRRHRGPHRDVVVIHAVGPGRRGDHLARCRRRDIGGVLLVSARASRATTWVLVDAVHAHPRHDPRPVVGPAVLTAPPFAAATAVCQSPALSTRPGCAVPVRETTGSLMRGSGNVTRAESIRLRLGRAHGSALHVEVPTFVSDEARLAQAMDVFNAVTGADVNEQEDNDDAQENGDNVYTLAR